MWYRWLCCVLCVVCAGVGEKVEGVNLDLDLVVKYASWSPEDRQQVDILVTDADTFAVDVFSDRRMISSRGETRLFALDLWFYNWKRHADFDSTGHIELKQVQVYSALAEEDVLIPCDSVIDSIEYQEKSNRNIPASDITSVCYGIESFPGTLVGRPWPYPTRDSYWVRIRTRQVRYMIEGRLILRLVFGSHGEKPTMGRVFMYAATTVFYDENSQHAYLNPHRRYFTENRYGNHRYLIDSYWGEKAVEGYCAENPTHPDCPSRKEGDFNGDDEVNFDDFLVFGGAYGTRQGEPEYNEQCDLDGDGMVDFLDFLLFAKKFGN